MTTEHDLLGAWRAEETGQPLGWDFSRLVGRMTESAEPWNLDKKWRDALHLARHVLDMGTGGGEFLRRFAKSLPRDTVATEGWPPNVPVATAALEPYGVTVVQHDPDTDVYLPFLDGRFDLVLNRHEAFRADEVARVLSPGGVFLTQQVGGDEMAELHAATGHKALHPEVTLQRCRKQLAAAGLEVLDDGEHRGWYTFQDVAALVAYLQLVPWDVPDDFSVDRYPGSLLRLHDQGPARGEPLRLSRVRFWVRARKPLS